MASTSIYLNFPGTAEQALRFYAQVFGTELAGPLFRYGGMPAQEGAPPMPEAVQNAVMHGAVPIFGGHLLMASDALEGFGPPLQVGNHASISLHPDSREQADALFAALSDGGTVAMPMEDTFWGAYFGYLIDRFGVQWMVNFEAPQG
jgi:PhnB protein